MNVATAAREATAQKLPRYVVTAGGLLWRRRAGQFYVCLISAPDRKFYSIPRAPVHEDERLTDAAVRVVREQTGFVGKAEKQLARASSPDGEVACLFLMECSDDPRFESAARKISAVWVPLDRAFDVLATASERSVIRRASLALAAPIDAVLPFEEPAIAATRTR